jgi:hypothetical protein
MSVEYNISSITFPPTVKYVNVAVIGNQRRLMILKCRGIPEAYMLTTAGGRQKRHNITKRRNNG